MSGRIPLGEGDRETQCGGMLSQPQDSAELDSVCEAERCSLVYIATVDVSAEECPVHSQMEQYVPY